MTLAYQTVPVETDPNTIAANALAFLVANIPGYVPNDGDLENWAILAFSFMLAQSRDVASIEPDNMFKRFGITVIGLQPIAAAAAQVPLVVTAVNAAGYTLPAGTQIGWQATGDTIIPFTLDEDAVIPVGSTVSPQVTATAVTPGVAANSPAGGPVPVLTLIDTYAFVESLTAEAPSAGGVEAETDASYMNRLVSTLQLQAPRPILPNDFAVLATSIAGVYRAIGINGYNPADGTTNNVKMVAVGLVDENGAAVSGAIKAEVVALLESMREINFVVNTIDPTLTAINVVTEIHAAATYDPAAVVAAVTTALTTALSPANWGGGNRIPPTWDTSANVVRYLQVARIIEDVPGVDHIVTLTVNGAQADVALAGEAPLPNPAAPTVTHD